MNRVCVVMLLSTVTTLAAANDCAIDVVMKAKFEETNERSMAAVENSIQERDLEKEACLPTLSKMNGALNATVPDLSGLAKNLGTQLRNLACNAMDSALEEMASSLNAGWEAPFGMGDVGAGVGTDGNGGGVTVSKSDEVKDVFQGQVLGTASDFTGAGVNVVGGAFDEKTSGITGVNRDSADSGDDLLNEIDNEAGNAFDNF